MRPSSSSLPNRDCKNPYRRVSNTLSEPWTKSRTPWPCISCNLVSEEDGPDEVARRRRMAAETRIKIRVKLRRRKPNAMSAALERREMQDSESSCYDAGEVAQTGYRIRQRVPCARLTRQENTGPGSFARLFVAPTLQVPWQSFLI